MTERLEIKAALTVDDAGTITGIAWPFGSPDRVGDVIEKGAFTSPEVLPMLFAHDQAQVIGVWDEISETPDGLTVKGRLLVDDVERAREVRAMIRTKAVSGLSIGFRTKASKPRQRGRTITALDLHEISVVAVPSHPGAQITSIKAADGTAPHEENHLENEAEIETKNDPVVSPEELKALKADIATIKAKLNRPTAANNNVPAPANDNDLKALDLELKRTLLEQKALTISLPGTGGNLVNDTLMTQILEKLGKSNPIRQLANSIQLDTGLLKIPRLVSGVAPGSVTETDTKPESTPTFEQISIEPFMMGAQVLVSRSQLEDSAVNLVSWISGHIANKFGELESGWFVKGNGTTQAEGVMTSTEVQEIESSAAALDVDDLLDLFYSVKSSYANAGAWVMNRKTARVVRGLKDSDGNLIWERSLQAGEPGRILGQPVYMADDMPDPVAGNAPIIFGDFYRGYLITDRVAFEPSVDYAKFSENDLVQFVGRRRVGGKVIMGEALTKLKLKAA
ncbi:phage major capsid protein [Sinorhizobium meliloti]|uniref:phage major capsid protein n=1 Tax=Rhizobium meliloti TaxID=382 RepID=UPI000FD743ED|nr:phage major capsid protein [Sinorhizobium meliloti]RVE93510.1 phage major capsid protein [Sinorhizobium meliloti]RVH34347.1 phage major capsid protein [Sinorhizobium meliloti]